MPKGFSDEEFLSEFKLLYSYLWDDVCAKAKEYQRMDDGLEKKGFPKRYFFPSPVVYIKKEKEIGKIKGKLKIHAKSNPFLFELLHPNLLS